MTAESKFGKRILGIIEDFQVMKQNLEETLDLERFYDKDIRSAVRYLQRLSHEQKCRIGFYGSRHFTLRDYGLLPEDKFTKRFDEILRIQPYRWFT